MIQPNINNYKEFFKGKILILNPDTGVFVKMDEWKKESDPTRAEVVAIDTPYYRIAIRKKFVGESLTFKRAQKAAAEVEILGQKCRCPRRNECTYIYDARFNGLDEALELIGGDPIKGLIWTCDEDADPEFARRSGATYAWYFYGTGGNLYYYYVYIAIRCQAVTLFPTERSE